MYILGCSSTLLDFENVANTTFSVPVPQGYGNFNWSSINLLNASYAGNYSGFYTALTSGQYVIYGTAGTMYSLSNTFTLNSFVSAAGWSDNLCFNIAGFRASIRRYFQGFLLQGTVATIITLNWTDIDMLTLSSCCGIAHTGFQVFNQYFAIDNMCVTF
ncbi:unnamed protein product [Didymodactylos carnosus]|uniref:Uncharacterized protein n=1 Tax=Didymodactylos carnosus TaxID=1234261 RepID=A0A814QZW9_9BILA|nr:unnamed protein product [Didymodactylos carnosus]CAF3890404.1 unnamed protein product [Didymodactylos carnosus]